MLDDVGQCLFLELALTRGFKEVFEQFVEQFVNLEKEAKDSARVMKAETDTLLRQMAGMKDEQQKRTAELISLAEKAGRDSEDLRRELENVMASAPQDGGEACELRRRLAEADVDLCSLRTSNRKLSDNVTNLEEQLSKWIPYGRDASAKAEDLEEKLRCSICMDRPKDAVFACGHTFCGQCASEWKKCYYNCQSERRQKPVKYSFPIYL